MELLSSDALSMITGDLNAQEVARLWLCGCKALQWKLTDGGGVQSFNYLIDLSLGAVWPSLVSEFRRLTHFSMKSPTDARFASVKGVNLLMLPRTLTSMDLAFMFDAYWLKVALERDPAQFSNLIKLEVSGYDRDEKRGGSDVDDFPPWRMGNHVHLLPRSLTHLRMDIGFRIAMPTVNVEMLPPQLEMLHMSTSRFPFGMMTAASLDAIIPKNLTSLVMEYQEDEERGWDWLAGLPRGLQKLAAECKQTPSAAHSDKYGITAKDLHGLPPHLTYLSMPAQNLESTELYEALPQTLQHLSYGVRAAYGGPRGTLPPPVLHDLREWCCGGLPLVVQSPDFAVELPKSLTKIGSPVDASVLSLLPKSLTSLVVTNLTVFYASIGTVESDMNGSPRGILTTFEKLQSLDIRIAVSSPLLSAAHAMPPTLTSLWIGTTKLPLDFVKILPATLESLVVQEGPPASYDRAILLHLPPRMKVFCIPGSVVMGKAHASALPRTLEQLKVGQMVVKNSEHLRLLPSKLTSLTFLCHELQLNMVINLPPYLLHLTVTPTIATNPAVLRHLPPRLLSFLVKGPQNGPLAEIEHLSDLPKSLTALQFPWIDGMSPFHVKFPPHLNSLIDTRSGSVSAFTQLSNTRFAAERPNRQASSSKSSGVQKN